MRESLGNLTPVAEPQVLPSPLRLWSALEWQRIRRGHRASDPAQRWHAVVERDRLYLYRSATGCGIYEAQFAPRGRGWTITQLVMCGDAEVHRRDSDEMHVLHVEAIIDAVLLGEWNTSAIRALQLVPA